MLEDVVIPLQGTLKEVVKNTWARGGVLGFFSGNEAGDSYIHALKRYSRNSRHLWAAQDMR